MTNGIRLQRVARPPIRVDRRRTELAARDPRVARNFARGTLEVFDQLASGELRTRLERMDEPFVDRDAFVAADRENVRPLRANGAQRAVSLGDDVRHHRETFATIRMTVQAVHAVLRGTADHAERHDLGIRIEESALDSVARGFACLPIEAPHPHEVARFLAQATDRRHRIARRGRRGRMRRSSSNLKSEKHHQHWY